MAALTLKNIPDELLARLRERAVRNRRSLTGEILTILERAVPSPVESERLAGEVRELRRQYGLAATTEGDELAGPVPAARAFADGLRLGALSARAREIATYAEAAKGSAADLDPDLERAALATWPDDRDGSA